MNWRKLLRRIALFAGLLIVAIVVAASLLVRSPWFHRAMLAQMVTRAQAATGGRLNIRRLDFRLHPLTLELYGIVLHGSEPASARPLLEIEKLTVGVRLRALLDRKVELSQLLIEHPVANLIVSRENQNNLPTPPAETKSNTTVWTLAVGRTLLTRGEIFYNDKKSQLDANLYNLHTEIHFAPALTQYGGAVSYQSGTLKYADYSSLPHALEARFSATPAGATLDSLLLRIGSSQVKAQGHLVNYVTPNLNGSYQILIHTDDFSSLSTAAAPSGDLQINGNMKYQDAAGKPLLRTMSADGTISGRTLQATSTEARIAVENLAARYRLAEGRFDLHDLTADLIGGRLQGELSVKNVENASGGTFHVRLQHASVESARLSMRRADLRRMPVTGTVNTSLHGTWADSLKSLQVLSDADVTGAVWKDSSKEKLVTPVDVIAHLTYEGVNKSVTLRQTSVQVPSASAIINGQIGNHSNLQVHAVSGDLHRLSELAASLTSTESKKTVAPIDVSGKAKLDAVVQGSLARPSISGEIAAQDLEVQGSQWKTAQIALSANPSELRISQASLVSAQRGSLHLTAEVGLRNWSYLSANPIRANLTAHDISLGELEHLGYENYPIAGNLSATISLSGSQLHPAGHGSLEIVKASAYDQPIRNFSLRFQTANDSIHSQLTLDAPAGTASGTVDFTPKNKAYSVDLQVPHIVIHKLHAVTEKNLPLDGTLTAFARGSGTLERPQLEVAVQIPTLHIQDTTLSAIKAAITINNREAHLSLNSNLTRALNSNLPAADFRADANVDLVGDYKTQASIETSQIPLAPFLALYAPGLPPGFAGATELHGSLTGPLKDPSKIVAHLTIPTLTATYQSLQFSIAAPIHADYTDSVLVVQPAEFRGTETSLRFEGRIPIARGEPMSFNARGNLDLQLVSIFDTELQSRGTADFDVRATGNLPHPDVRGQIQIRDAGFTTSSAPVGVSKLNGTLDLLNDRIQITSLTGDVGGGQASAGGSIVLRPTLQFNVALQEKNMRLLYPSGVRSTLDADLTFTGDLKAATLRGRTLIQSLNFTPDFNLSTVSSQFNAATMPPLSQGFADNIKLAVSVQSSQNLTARSSQLNLSGMVNLRINGTAADPVVIGRVDLASGELFFMNNRYELQRGIVSFNDPNQTRPVLNVQATTTVEQYNLTLTLVGPLDRLSTSYVSNPALPTADIISLIYRGQTVEEAASAGTSTDSLLASGVASQFSSGLRNLTGISSLQIDPLLGGNGTNPSARIAVQQRVTRDFLFTFSTDVTQPESEIILGQYQLTPRWSVSGERDQYGGVSVMGQFRTKF